MHITNVPYTKIDWDEVPITKHSGETGHAWWRTFETGNIRIRLVEYSPGYRADHWCCRGHVIYLLDGGMISEHKDGLKIQLKKGMTYCFSDNQENPHKSFSRNGVYLLILD
jgi:uncharacterized cupin superfamily protein